MAFYKRLVRTLILLCFALLPVFGLAAQDAAAEADSEAEAAPGGEAAPKSGGAVSAWFKKTIFSFGGSILIFQEDYGFEAAPIPVLPAPGFAFTMPLWSSDFGGVALETTLDMYFTYYKYSYELDRPVPAEIENRSAFVFGPVFALQAQGHINLNRVRLRLNLGIAADPRIVLLAPDLNEADLDDANMQTDDIRTFYKDFNRWLYPVLGLGADFHITPRWSAGLDLRTWAPLDFSGIDRQFLGWRFGIGLRASRLIGAPSTGLTRDAESKEGG